MKTRTETSPLGVPPNGSAGAWRERVDWAEVRTRTAQSPFAEAFLLLADRLHLTG